MTKITEMDDPSVIRCCHLYCEENNVTGEFRKYREEVEAEFVYCPYLQEYIAPGLCYDMQMIKGGYIKKSALDIQIDRDALEKHCTDCKNQL